ncbi:MAG TPA: CHAT domain-containing protein [Polyangiaceae bacterium]|nr:CHAT domain-containing protein [Polyangiaceae bacterium]
MRLPAFKCKPFIRRRPAANWLGLIALAVLAAVVLFQWRIRDEVTTRPALRWDVTFKDFEGRAIPVLAMGSHPPTHSPERSPIDSILEVRIQGLGPGQFAVLFLFDSTGQSVRPALPAELPFERLADVEVSLPLRSLRPLTGATRALLAYGRKGQLESALRQLATAAPKELSLKETIEKIQDFDLGSSIRSVRIPNLEPQYSSTVLDAAEAALEHGDLMASLVRVEGASGQYPSSDLARAAGIGAEAAFGLGRIGLARRLSETGLAAKWKGGHWNARLRRVQILARAEGDVSADPPAERELLRKTEGERSAPIESALDAALDFRLALLHDRFSTAPPRAAAAARRLIEHAEGLPPSESRWRELAAPLCRAATSISKTEPTLGQRWVKRGLELAQPHRAAEAYCMIAAADAARHASNLEESERFLERARAQLADAILPREQREVWFSTALQQSERGLPAEALIAAKRAAQWVTFLLALEVDVADREALLTNALGYYGAAARLGAVANLGVDAIALAEAGKGRGLFALLRGSTASGARAISPMRDLHLEPARSTGTAPDPESRRGDPFARELGTVEEMARRLEQSDAVLSYTFLGANSQRRPEIAVGVLTSEGASMTLVEQPETLLDDVVTLAAGVEHNDEFAAREVGKRLHATLIEPVQSQLQGKTRLFISPHLRLHTLPWAALYDGSSFLIERFGIARMLPLTLAEAGWRDAQTVFEHGNQTNWVLAVNARHPTFPPLPGFDPLIERARSAFTRVTLLGEREATRTALLSSLGAADAALFAGHASYDPARPLRSALYTSAKQADTSAWPEDRVEARDLMQLRNRLSTVVLLGCETARLWRGRSSYSDEAIGLARALVLSGSRTVIGALWPVLDRDAEDFSRALLGMESSLDIIRHVQEVSRCLASQRCPNRGIATWASFLVDTR